MKIFPNQTLNKLKEGLSKTRNNLFNKISEVISRKAIIDDDTFDELEAILLSSDLGSELTEKIISKTRTSLLNVNDRSLESIKNTMKDELLSIFDRGINPNYHSELEKFKPYIILIVGVNGSGKTTTIAKLANKYKLEGKKVIIASADTYRAAANAQLKTWSKRVGVEIVEVNSKDPSSVVFETINIALNNNYDIVLIDTAGRLHNNKNLMLELTKIIKVTNRLLHYAPNDVLLVLDSNSGQNIILQVDEFNKSTKISGLILTKLDGTAKGGAILQIASQNKMPIKYLGIGEAIEDIQEFNAELFIDAIIN
ncbi:MAG: signal recognition particle-docking protein FtsY [Ignavibacteriales bacterium]|nr:signal recognition particle-docking protein FtsY [Ignavibacteriales bacterium]